MFTKSKQSRYIFILMAFVSGFLLFSLTMSNALVAKAVPPRPKCPDGTLAPSGNVQNCEPETWAIRCFIKVNKIAVYSTTNPEGNVCPNKLKPNMFDSTCYAVNPSGGGEEASNNPELIPCPDNQAGWNIKCYAGESGSLESFDCPTTFWEFADSGRCYLIPSDSTSGGSRLVERDMRRDCDELEMMKPKIPPGCPGSTQQGPPSPGTCESIPPGCPGSTQQGSPSPGVHCPYAPVAAPEEGQEECTDSGGTWDDTRNNCMCSAPLVVRNGVCENPNSNSGSYEDEPIVTDCEPEDGDALSVKNCGIIRYLVVGINFLSAIAGMAIIGAIMFAGYQYMTAQDNSGQVEAAKKRILWAIIALGIFIFMYAFLNWIVPGGVL